MTTRATPVHLRLLVRTALVLSALVLGASPVWGDTTHIVAPGHTLQKIAKRYRTTVEALREANGLEPSDRLKPGQRIVIPDSNLSAEPEARNSSRKDPKEADKPSRADDRKDRDSSKQRESQTSRGGRPRSYAQRPTRPGMVHLIRDQEEWKGRVMDRRRRVMPEAMDHFVHLLRDYESKPHAIHPRLVELMTKVSDHFGGRPLRIVSGYRHYSPAQYTAHSNHNDGNAVDFHVQGVPNEVLRDFCHSLPSVGVGYYPNSSFIHLDVRAVATRWTDEAGPGEPPRYTSRQ